MKNVLLVDAGNTRLKWSLQKEKEELLEGAVLYGSDSPVHCFSDLIEANKDSIDGVLLVSVQGKEFVEQVKKKALHENLKFTNISSLAKLGDLKNAYEYPQQLGADRFVAMLAGYTRSNGNPCIIVDCGTAVTIDAIDETGQHLGGLILPGLQVASNSLVRGTQQLELKDSNAQRNLLTTNTTQAILSGSFHGLAGAINETCSKIQKQMINQNSPNEVVKIICGGDAQILLPELSDDFEIQTDLVMQGLELIAEQYLDYWDNESKKSLQ